MKSLLKLIGLTAAIITACSDNNTAAPNDTDPTSTFKYLALGDSYTIGESVCATCRFPAQLKDSLSQNLNADVSLKIIAQTGWTTSDLKNAIAAQNPPSNYDLVTLLIGVNNQYQNKPFSLYQQEFPELVETAISLAKGDKNNVIVVSIPDYGYTPFGQSNQTQISAEIDQYNDFAQAYCESENIIFVNITDITREGISNPALVAGDGLHPSELAYTRFVNRIIPAAMETLQD